MTNPTAPDEWVAIGRVARPHGVRGEVRVALLCDGAETFVECVETGQVRLWREEGEPPHADQAPLAEIESLRPHQGQMLVFFEGVEDMDGAEALRGALLGLAARDLPSPGEEEYYHFDLEGLSVIDAETGEALGRVQRVEEMPASEMLLIQPATAGEKAFRVPFVQAFVGQVDLQARTVQVSLPPGFIESQR